MTMAYQMFAAINVGSNDISMKIFEITSKWGFKEVDSITTILELGSDTYRLGYVSNEKINELCNCLTRFKLKMKEYKVDANGDGHCYPCMGCVDGSEVVVYKVNGEIYTEVNPALSHGLAELNAKLNSNFTYESFSKKIASNKIIEVSTELELRALSIYVAEGNNCSGKTFRLKNRSKYGIITL